MTYDADKRLLSVALASEAEADTRDGASTFIQGRMIVFMAGSPTQAGTFGPVRQLYCYMLRI